MPLVPQDQPASRERPPWRGVVVGLLAAVVFIFGLAVAAYATRDRAGPVRPPVLDAGMTPDAAGLDDAVDAGAPALADAGELVTAEPEPDAGPVGVSAPPIELSLVITTAQPILEVCLAEALRFDPSFGGKMTLRAEVRGRTLRLASPAGSSPVFTGCLAGKSGRLEGAPTSANASLRVHLDGLRGVVTVEDAQLAE